MSKICWLKNLKTIRKSKVLGGRKGGASPFSPATHWNWAKPVFGIKAKTDVVFFLVFKFLWVFLRALSHTQ